MQVVCEATQNPSIPVQVAAFECLVRIMNLYYDKMAFYMERALFGVSSGLHSPSRFGSHHRLYCIAHRHGYEIS